MSTKSSIFLTKDNEHCYFETNMPNAIDGKFIGDTIVLELDKRNARLVLNDDNDLVIEIDPGSELYEQLNQIKDVKRKKATIEVYEPVLNRAVSFPPGADRISYVLDQIQENLNRRIRENLDAQILRRLSALGYHFKDGIEFAAFAKERLTICIDNSRHRPNKEHELYLDIKLPTRKLIATWTDKTEVNFTDTGIEVKYNV